MRVLCACCLKREPATGWFSECPSGDVYCSAECLDAHTDKRCACFVESDMHELYGDEDSIGGEL